MADGPARWAGTGKRSVRATGGARPNTTTPDLDATDAAKALADDEGIDLAMVEGTGAEGRITKDDVVAATETIAE